MTSYTTTFSVDSLKSAQIISDVLDGQVDSITFFEAPEGWQVTVNAESAHVQEHIQKAAQELGLSLYDLTCITAPTIDWLIENRRSFPPIYAGDFFIYGSFYNGDLPQNKHPLKLDAATAFGSGEHPTTAGCLDMITQLSHQGFAPKNALDMGCGSGILAIGAAKMWRCPILAADNDPEAVRVTHENTITNQVDEYITCTLSDGYSPTVLKPPYDLIIANILANPLCEMAGDLAANLSTHGHVILSGILNSQAQTVINAHIEKNVFLENQLIIGDWTILHLKR